MYKAILSNFPPLPTGEGPEERPVLRHKLAQDERIRIVNVRGIGYKLIINE